MNLQGVLLYEKNNHIKNPCMMEHTLWTFMSNELPHAQYSVSCVNRSLNIWALNFNHEL